MRRKPNEAGSNKKKETVGKEESPSPKGRGRAANEEVAA